MEENNNQCCAEMGAGNFKEAVCIDAMRIYDSCSDKDCLEDLRVYFSPCHKEVIEHATSVRLRSVEVACVHTGLEPVPFNKGFYAVNLTFFFDVCLDIFSACSPCPVAINGCATFSKKVVLYGSEGNVKMFCSDAPCACSENTPRDGGRVLPKATVQVAEPIALSAKLCEVPHCECCCCMPESVCSLYGGELDTESKRGVYVTLGLFTIVQIIRNVQMLIPAYDFCIPRKECVCATDNPCDMFKRIDFPTNEFFPPKVGDNGGRPHGRDCDCDRCCK